MSPNIPNLILFHSQFWAALFKGIVHAIQRAKQSQLSGQQTFMRKNFPTCSETFTSV